MLLVVSECEKAMIISTVITVNVREYLTEKAIAKNIFVINVLGPIINVASTLLNEFQIIILVLCGILTKNTLRE